MPAKRTMLMMANEAASVTGVPLRQVHRRRPWLPTTKRMALP